MPYRDLQRSLARLKDAGMLSAFDGHRPGALRRWGRILTPHIDDPVRVLMPTPDEMAALWRAGFKIRKRPAALVILMVGMFIIASHARGRRPTRWAPVPGSTANLRRFVGASRGSTFARRFDDLESAGLISRHGGLAIAPPSKWVVQTPEPVQVASETSMPEGFDPQWDEWIAAKRDGMSQDGIG